MKPLKSILLILILGLAACYSGSRLSQPDYTYLYDPDQKLIKPEVKIFHHQSDSSQFYFRINTENILYGKMKNDSDLTTRLLMKYQLYDHLNRDALIDSATIGLIDKGQDANIAYLRGRSVIHMPLGKLYRMRVYFRDEYKDLNTVYDYLFDKRLNGNQEFYLIKQNDQVVFNSVISNNDEAIKIFKSPLIQNAQYRMDSSDHVFKMTPPPFVEDVSQAAVNFNFNKSISIEDSIEIDRISHLNRLHPLDSNLLRFHFFYFQDGYPYVTSVDQLIDPIRYISTTAEYKRIINSLNQKKEVDQFWLKLGKDENKARQLIKEYYGRVEIANRNFSTYKEGWKTDRGIIYIVYGQPTTIYKDLNTESWIYGEENNILSISFNFKKIRSEESDNIYVLERNEDFKSNWYRAVDDWRQGRINS